MPRLLVKDECEGFDLGATVPTDTWGREGGGTRDHSWGSGGGGSTSKEKYNSSQQMIYGDGVSEKKGHCVWCTVYVAL